MKEPGGYMDLTAGATMVAIVGIAYLMADANATSHLHFVTEDVPASAEGDCL